MKLIDLTWGTWTWPLDTTNILNSLRITGHIYVFIFSESPHIHVPICSIGSCAIHRCFHCHARHNFKSVWHVLSESQTYVYAYPVTCKSKPNVSQGFGLAIPMQHCISHLMLLLPWHDAPIAKSHRECGILVREKSSQGFLRHRSWEEKPRSLWGKGIMRKMIIKVLCWKAWLVI